VFLEDSMKRRSGPRKTANLPESIQHQLYMYALAASAAGVGVVALAQSAEAKIVYTKLNLKIEPGNSYYLYLNHHGRIDFAIQNRSYNSRTNLLEAYAPAHNRVWVQSETQDYRQFAAALPAGVRISGSRFNTSGPLHFYLATAHSTFSAGPWKDVRNRYLGLQFLTKGKTHYGWARLSVEVKRHRIVATLTGYAYETIPGKPIKAGQTKDAPDDSTNENFEPNASLTNPIPNKPQPATLGALAMGSPGLSIWRRKEPALEVNSHGAL
jgi:hypothetical protein